MKSVRTVSLALLVTAVMLLLMALAVNGLFSNARSIAPGSYIADGSGPTPPPPGGSGLLPTITYIADGSGPTPPPPGGSGLLPA
jgi:hypothetical protein